MIEFAAARITSRVEFIYNFNFKNYRKYVRVLNGPIYEYILYS